MGGMNSNVRRAVNHFNQFHSMKEEEKCMEKDMKKIIVSDCKCVPLPKQEIVLCGSTV